MLSSTTSDYLELEYEPMTFSYPSISSNSPPLKRVSSIAYNGKYWIAGGFSTTQVRKIYSYPEVFDILQIARNVKAALKSNTALMHTLMNVNSILYSNAITNIKSFIKIHTLYYNSLINSAKNKYESLKSLGYVTIMRSIGTIHNMMISYDGIQWKFIDDNPFDFIIDSDKAHGTVFQEGGSAAGPLNVTDIKWNEKLSLWVAVSSDTRTLNYIWNGSYYAVLTVVPLKQGNLNYCSIGENSVNTTNPSFFKDNNGNLLPDSFHVRSHIATSPDGINWTSRGVPLITFNPSLTTVGSGYTIAPKYPCPIVINEIACSDTLTVITYVCMVNDQSPLGYNSVTGLITGYQNNNNGFSAGVAVSSNCITWSSKEICKANNLITYPGGYPRFPRGLAYNGGLWILSSFLQGVRPSGFTIGNEPYLTSSDGTIWVQKNRQNYLQAPTWNGLFWLALQRVHIYDIDPTTYYEVPYTGTKIVKSFNGLDWTVTTTISELTQYSNIEGTRIVWDGNFFIISVTEGNGSTGNIIHKTRDGIDLLKLDIRGNGIVTDVILPVLGGISPFPSSLFVGDGTMHFFRDKLTKILLNIGKDGWGTNNQLDKNFYAIVWCNTFWVIGGDPSPYNPMAVSYMKSLDGVTWTFPNTFNSTNGTVINKVKNVRDIIWNGSLIIAVGNKISSSSDGVTWTINTSPFSQCNAIAWNGKSTVLTVVSFGASTNGRQTVTVTASQSNLGISIGEAITIRNASDFTNIGTYIIVNIGTNSSTGQGTFTWTNTDGVSKVETSLVYAYSGLYVTGGIGGIATSITGTTSWTKSTRCPLSVVNDIAWNGYIWVAVGTGISQSIALSIDGLNWYSANYDTNFFTTCNAIAWNKSMWVAVGRGDDTIATSVDGYNWIGRGKEIFTNYGSAIGFDGTKWNAAGDGYYQIATSIDGITWTPYISGINIRGYANKTISLPYTGSATSSIKTIIDATVLKITTTTIEDESLEEYELQTRISALKYVIRFLYWKEIVDYLNTHINEKINQYKTLFDIDLLANGNLFVENESISGFVEYMQTSNPNILRFYSSLLKDGKKQSELDGLLLSIYEIHAQYNLDLLDFFNNMRLMYKDLASKLKSTLFTNYNTNSYLILLGFTDTTSTTLNTVLDLINPMKTTIGTTSDSVITSLTSAITSITYSLSRSDEWLSQNLSSAINISNTKQYITSNFLNFVTIWGSSFDDSSIIEKMFRMYIVFKNALPFKIVADKYYTDAKELLIEWISIFQGDSTIATTFNTPVNGIQTITVNAIENIEQNRVVTIIGASNSANDVRIALVLSVSGNTFTIQNLTGVASTGQSALVRYSDTAVPLTTFESKFKELFDAHFYNKLTTFYTLNNFNLYYNNTNLQSFKNAYNIYSKVYYYPLNIEKLRDFFEFELALLEFDRMKAINYARQALDTVRAEANYFESITRQTYGEHNFVTRTHYLKLLNTTFYNKSIFDTTKKISTQLSIGARLYPTLGQLNLEFQNAIFEAESTGCTPPITGWDGPTRYSTTIYSVRVAKNNLFDGTRLANENAKINFSLFDILSFDEPNKATGYQVIKINRSNFGRLDFFKIGNTFSIRNANSRNNIIDTTIFGVDLNNNVLLIFNPNGIKEVNSVAKAFSSSISITNYTVTPSGGSYILNATLESILIFSQLPTTFTVRITGTWLSYNDVSFDDSIQGYINTAIIGTDIPGASKGSNATWDKFNNVYYSLQKINNFKNGVGKQTNIVGNREYTGNGVIETYNSVIGYDTLSSDFFHDPIHKPTNVTISGNSNTNNNGVFKFYNSSTKGLILRIPNPTTSTGGNVATMTVSIPIVGMSAPIDGVQRIFTKNQLVAAVGGSISISGAFYSSNNVTDATIIEINGNMFSISNTNGIYEYGSPMIYTTSFQVNSMENIVLNSNSGFSKITLSQTISYSSLDPYSIVRASSFSEFETFTEDATPYSLKNSINFYKDAIFVLRQNNELTQTFIDSKKNQDITNINSFYVSAATVYLNSLNTSVNSKLPILSSFNITSFNKSPDENTVTIICNNIGDFDPLRNSITITGASNSGNNIVEAEVTVVNETTIKITNANGVSAINQTAIATYGDSIEFKNARYSYYEGEQSNPTLVSSDTFSTMVSTIKTSYATFLTIKNSTLSGTKTTKTITTFGSGSSTQSITVDSIANIKQGITIRITGASNSTNNGTFKVISINGNTFTINNPNGVAVTTTTNAGSVSYIELEYDLNTAEATFNTINTIQNSYAYNFIIDRIKEYNLEYSRVKSLVTRTEKNLARWLKMKVNALKEPFPIGKLGDGYGRQFIMSIPPDEIGYWTPSPCKKFKLLNDGTIVFPKVINYQGTKFVETVPPYNISQVNSYNNDQQYALYDVVEYNGYLYTCIKDKTEYDAIGVKGLQPMWNQNKWKEVKYPSVFNGVGNMVEGSPENFPPFKASDYDAFTPITSYKFGSLVSDSGKVYRCITDFFGDTKVKNIPPGDTSYYWSKRNYPKVIYKDKTIEANPANFQSLSTTNDTPAYDSAKDYKYGDSVKYNNKFYYYRYPPATNPTKTIKNIAPDQTENSVTRWFEITYPIVYVSNENTSYYIECTSTNFSALDINNYNAYSSTTEYTYNDIVSFNNNLYECDIQTGYIIGINITNTTYWESLQYHVVNYNGEWTEYTPNLIPRLNPSDFPLYSDSTYYYLGDVVSVSTYYKDASNTQFTKNAIFQCIDDVPLGVNIKNIPPSFTEYWKSSLYPLGLIDGTTVIETHPLNFPPLNELDYHEYNNNWLYYKGDLVSYNGLVYECTNTDPNKVVYPTSITGISPLTSTGYWEQASTQDLDFINNTYFKSNNIFPWNPLTTKVYSSGTVVLWKGFIYQCMTNVFYREVLNLNSDSDIALINSYIPSRNEYQWMLIQTYNTIPTIYSNSTSYVINSIVFINDSETDKDVILSIASPFRLRSFKLVAMTRYEPKEFKFPKIKILNTLDSSGFYKTGKVLGNNDNHDIPRYGSHYQDPFRLQYFASELKLNVIHNILLPYNEIKNNCKNITGELRDIKYLIDNENAMIQDQGYVGLVVLVKSAYLNRFYSWANALVSSTITKFNQSNGEKSIADLLDFVYKNLKNILLENRNVVKQTQSNVNVLKMQYFSIIENTVMDNPYKYMNPVALAAKPPRKCFRDLGVGDESLIRRKISDGQIHSSALDDFIERKKNLIALQNNINKVSIQSKYLVNYDVMFHFKYSGGPGNMISTDITVPINYYKYAENNERKIYISLFIIDRFDDDPSNHLRYAKNYYYSDEADASYDEKSSAAIINTMMVESLTPPEYTLPGSQAERDLLVVTYESKDSFVKAVSQVAKALVGLCAAAFQSLDFVSAVSGTIKFIGNWIISGRPDGEVTPNMPGGEAFLNFSNTLPEIKWPSFNENATSIIQLKQEVNAYTNSIKNARNSQPPKLDNLGDVFLTIARLLRKYETFELIIEEVPEKYTKSYYYPPDPTKPTRVPFEYSPPKYPTKIQLYNEDLINERTKLQIQYEELFRRIEIEELEIEKTKKINSGRLQRLNEELDKLKSQVNNKAAVPLIEQQHNIRSQVIAGSGGDLIPEPIKTNNPSLRLSTIDKTAFIQRGSLNAQVVTVRSFIPPPGNIKPLGNKNATPIGNTNKDVIDAETKVDNNTKNIAEANEKELDAKKAQIQAEIDEINANKSVDAMQRKGLIGSDEAERIKRNINELTTKINETIYKQIGLDAQYDQELAEFNKQVRKNRQLKIEAENAYNKEFAEYERLKKARINVDTNIRDLALRLEAQKVKYEIKKVAYNNSVISLEFSENVFSTKLLERPRFFQIMSFGLPPAITAQYFNIVDKFSTLTNPIQNAYKNIVSKVKTSIVSKADALGYQKIKPSVAKINTAINSNIKAAKAWANYGAGPLMEIAGIALTAYSMGAFSEGETLGF